jgi:hypothetical protein
MIESIRFAAAGRYRKALPEAVTVLALVSQYSITTFYGIDKYPLEQGLVQHVIATC